MRGRLLGRVYATQCIEDRNEQDEAEEHDTKLPEPGEDVAESLQSLELIVRPHCAICTFPDHIPKDQSGFRVGNHGLEPQIQRKLAGLVAFIRPVHQ